MVQILRAELETNMALLGARSLAELVPEMVNSKRVDLYLFDNSKL
jgi:L-lactate dehydrogenase (cytochrome)